MQQAERIRNVFSIGLLVVLAMSLASSSVSAQNSERHPAIEKPQVNVKVLRQDTYQSKIDGAETTATIVEVTLNPLAGSPPHRHPGPVSGYVVEGTFEFQVEGGPLKTLKAGDAFFEPTMILHKVGRNPDSEKRARVLATIVHPSNAKSIVIPEPSDQQSKSSTDTFDKPRSLTEWSAKSSSGDHVPISKLAGNPFVLVMFRGHGCYHCVEQLAAIAEAEEKFREKGVRIVALSNDSVAQMNDALEKRTLPFTVLADAESTLAKSLGSERMDNWHGLLVVDANGNARSLTSGSEPFMEFDEVLADIQSLGLTGEQLASHKIVTDANSIKQSLTQGTESPETCAVPAANSGPETTVSTPADFAEASKPKPLTPDLPVIGLLIYDNVLQTEITAPSDVFSKHSEDGKQMFNVVTIAASYGLVETEEGLKLFPDYTYENSPKLDVIVVPSAYDMTAKVKDNRLVQFIKSQNENTKFTVSNCGGASLIGESGIANGKKIVTWIGGGQDLQKNYPNLQVQDDAKLSFVEDGKFLSSNGNLASYISSLELLEKLTSKKHRKFVESYLYLERLQNWKE